VGIRPDCYWDAGAANPANTDFDYKVTLPDYSMIKGGDVVLILSESDETIVFITNKIDGKAAVFSANSINAHLKWHVQSRG
jgi:hypothetical protein